MAHPTRTGDLVVFSAPPYQFDAATPGHADRPLGLLRPARLRARRAGPRHATRTCAPRSSPAGRAIRRGVARGVRSIDLAPTAAFLLGVPAPQHSQGIVRRDLLRTRAQYTPLSIVGLERLPRPARADHALLDGLNVTFGGAPQLATLFDEEAAALPGPDAAAGGRRQRRRLAAQLGPARRHAGHRRGERVGARRDEPRQPRVRLRRRAAARAPGARRLPVPLGQHRRGGHGRGAGLAGRLDRARRERRARRRDRRHGAHHAGARARRRDRGPRLPRRGGAHPRRGGAPARGGRAGAGRGHPRGRRARRQRGRRPARRSRGRGRSSASWRRCRTRRSTS